MRSPCRVANVGRSRGWSAHFFLIFTFSPRCRLLVSASVVFPKSYSYLASFARRPSAGQPRCGDWHHLIAPHSLALFRVLRSPASVPEQDHPKHDRGWSALELDYAGRKVYLSTTCPCQSCVFTTVERKTPTSLWSCFKLSTGQRLFWHRTYLTSSSPPLSVTQRNST